MSLLNRMRKQTATYWGSPEPDGYGSYTFDTPITLMVRWEDVSEVVQGANGESINSRSTVYVGQDVDVEGYLYLGTSSATDPTEVDGAYRIRSFSKVPNLRASKYLRKAYL